MAEILLATGIVIGGYCSAEWLRQAWTHRWLPGPSAWVWAVCCGVAVIVCNLLYVRGGAGADLPGEQASLPTLVTLFWIIALLQWHLILYPAYRWVAPLFQRR